MLNVVVSCRLLVCVKRVFGPCYLKVLCDCLFSALWVAVFCAILLFCCLLLLSVCWWFCVGRFVLAWFLGLGVGACWSFVFVGGVVLRVLGVVLLFVLEALHNLWV